MAQTPCRLVSQGDALAYKASGDKAAGTIVIVGTRPLIVSKAICYSENPLGTVVGEHVWDIPQAAEIISAGTKVYWNTSGTPVLGDASSGAATASAGGNYLLGTAVPVQPNGTSATAATDAFVRVKLDGMSVNIATVGGSMTADDITGSDGTLSICGMPGSSSAGGIVSVLGGTGDSGYAGGAVGMTGGTGASGYAGGAASVAGGVPSAGNAAGGAASVVGGQGSGSGNGGAASLTGGRSAASGGTGTGGAATVTGGAGGGTSGAGGAASLIGGAAAAGNSAGGAAAVTGGAGSGSSAGGAASLTGGSGGATGVGGAIAIAGGAGGATSGTGGAVTIAGGAGTNGNANGGAVSITGGAKNGSGSNGAVKIAADKPCEVTIGYASGKLYLVGLPTSDPSSANQVYVSTGTLKLSAG